MIGLQSRPSNIRYINPYQPLPWQVEPWRDTSFLLLLTGSAGGGKSRIAAEKLHGFCLQYPGAQALMLRKTRESMNNSTVLFMERTIIGNDSRVVHLSSKLRFEYANGSVLAYGGMADDDQRQQIRSIGVEGGVDICWMEEANAFEEDDFNELLGRMRGTKAPWRQIILTTNPDAPNHWINQRLILGGEAKVYYSNAGDNYHNPTEYAANLEKLTGTLRDRLARGLWVAAEGMYFEEWDPSVHLCKPFEVPTNWTRWASVDYGFADPFCCLWYARNPENRRIYLYREAYAAGLRDEQQAKLIAERSKGERLVACIGDPSMFAERRESQLPSIAQIYHANKVPLSPGTNNRHQGWATVRRALSHDEGEPRLQVMDGRAPNLVRTLPSMVRDPLDPEDLADKIQAKKTEDHAVDCLRYGLMAEGQPSQQLRQIDFRVA